MKINKGKLSLQELLLCFHTHQSFLQQNNIPRFKQSAFKGTLRRIAQWVKALQWNWEMACSKPTRHSAGLSDLTSVPSSWWFSGQNRGKTQWISGYCRCPHNMGPKMTVRQPNSRYKNKEKRKSTPTLAESSVTRSLLMFCWWCKRNSILLSKISKRVSRFYKKKNQKENIRTNTTCRSLFKILF